MRPPQRDLPADSVVGLSITGADGHDRVDEGQLDLPRVATRPLSRLRRQQVVEGGNDAFQFPGITGRMSGAGIHDGQRIATGQHTLTVHAAGSGERQEHAPPPLEASRMLVRESIAPCSPPLRP